jgi:hypothetical protein
VVGGSQVAEPAHVGRHRLVRPAIAAQHEVPGGQSCGRIQEERLHPRLAVRQPVGQEVQVAREPRLRRNGIMRGGIERVVDRPAQARSVCGVAIHHGRAAAVGEHRVETRQRRVQRMQRPGLLQHLQRGRGIHVPEHFQRTRACCLHRVVQQLVVEHADSRRLDHHIGRRRLRGRKPHGIRRGLVDDDMRPVGGLDVAMALPVERIRFIERDLPAAPC